MSAAHPRQHLQTTDSGCPPLATTRALLTSLVSSLPSDPPPTISISTAANPLHHASPSVRSILTTLHILYPTLLLPALDLLDRNLVTRVTQTDHTAATLQEPPAPPVVTPNARIHLTSDGRHRDPAGEPRFGRPGAEREDGTNNQNALKQIYLVCSSQASHSRSHSLTERHYIVRLSAWNCNCAAFAFSAFPASQSSSAALHDLKGDDQERYWTTDEMGASGEVEEGEKWEFGGMSRDGMDGGGVPCCKHLLACVLAERWDGWLGRFVNERRVGRREMAGLGCDG